jgi:hypothetical protein
VHEMIRAIKDRAGAISGTKDDDFQVATPRGVGMYPIKPAFPAMSSETVSRPSDVFRNLVR